MKMPWYMQNNRDKSADTYAIKKRREQEKKGNKGEWGFHKLNFFFCWGCKFDWSMTKGNQLMRSKGVQIRADLERKLCPKCSGKDVRLTQA